MKTIAERIKTPHNKAVISLLDAELVGEDSKSAAMRFANVGYWKGVEDGWELASIKLMEILVGFLSERNGSVLDVACGTGATTKFLSKYFDPGKIIGINISEAQLKVCERFVPECKFKLMDATQLEFDDSTFDNVLCVESAPNFDTRQKFLEEVHRVLKVGGKVAMSDWLFDRDDFLNEVHPKENYLPDLTAYEELLTKIGFRDVRIEDITEHSVCVVDKFLSKRPGYPDPRWEAMRTGRYCLVYAVK